MGSIHTLAPFTMKLDPVSIKFFIAVVEEGSIAAAAEREHISAPALSKRISTLEDLFHTTLLIRYHKGVEPTAAGYALLHLARRAVNYLDDIHTEMFDYASGIRGQVRVYANISAITQFLPGDLASFLAEHPAVKIRLEECNSLATLQSVAEVAADVGVFTVVPHAENVDTLPYEEDKLAVVVRRGHALTGRKSIRFEEALSWDFIGLRTGSAINMQLSQAAKRIQKDFRLRIQVSGYDALCLMVSSGLGIGIAPHNLIKLFVKRLGLTEVALNEPWARRCLGIAVRNREALSPAAESLVLHLQACAASRREA